MCTWLPAAWPSQMKPCHPGHLAAFMSFPSSWFITPARTYTLPALLEALLLLLSFLSSHAWVLTLVSVSSCSAVGCGFALSRVYGSLVHRPWYSQTRALTPLFLQRLQVSNSSHTYGSATHSPPIVKVEKKQTVCIVACFSTMDILGDRFS